MLPRPSHIPVLKTWNITKNQQYKDTLTTQKVRPSLKSSCIPVFNCKKREPVNQPKIEQVTNNLPRPCEGNAIKQLQTTSPTMQTRKTPLLPTLPAQNRQTYTPRPSTFNNSRKTTWRHGTASTSLAYVKAVHLKVESLCQNCVMGRCASLHIHILLQVSFHFGRVWWPWKDWFQSLELGRVWWC